METRPSREALTPQEEIAYLKNEILRRDRASRIAEGGAERPKIISEVVREYAPPAKDLPSQSNTLGSLAEGEVVLDLSPETHDAVVGELLGIMHEHGIKSAIAAAEKKGPHVADDFHRFLVAYLHHQAGQEMLTHDTKLMRMLDMTLYEVVLPEGALSGEDSFQKHVQSMEQLYAGLLSVASNPDAGERFSLEIAVSRERSDIVFFIAVPSGRAGLFEQQLAASFPSARYIVLQNDYNIFNEEGVAAGAIGAPLKNSVFPLKTYKEVTQDPVSLLVGAFTKLKETGEGASIQIVVGAPRTDFLKQYSGILERLKRGVSPKEAIAASSLMEGFGKALKELAVGTPKKKEDEKQIDERVVGAVTEKMSATILECTIRIVASAHTTSRAGQILDGLKSSFRQFDTPLGGGVAFRDLAGKEFLAFLHEYSYRNFDEKIFLPLNLTELTSIFHFPMTAVSPELKHARMPENPLPPDAPTDGVVLGVNSYRGARRSVHMTPDDRLRHLYVIGQTGTGKSTLLKNLVIQDIRNGEGVCMIDPHGTDIQEVLAAVPPARAGDVIYFDPANVSHPMGLNFLEYDKRYPEQKTFVVDELLNIFQKLYGNVPESMGPAFGQYFRNAALLVMDDPDTGNTLLDISRVLVDSQYRAMKVSRCLNPIIVQFWRDLAAKATGEQALQNIAGYITNKFDVFIANEVMRPIIGQEKSAFNFRDVMDSRKILLVNLSKGRLGDINAHLIGLVLVGKILMAALSRVDSIGRVKLPPFYLYIDEFQNITTDSIATILSEARKYGLSLTIAHQYIDQLEEKIKGAVFGNVGSLVAFRVSAKDAEFLEPQFAPVFKDADILNLENRKAVARLLLRGNPAKPINLETLSPLEVDWNRVDQYQKESAERYGRPREEVEAEILQKFEKPIPPQGIAPK